MKELFNKNKRLMGQFIKFCMVGSVGATINYSLFFLLYHFLGVYYITASGTGFLCSLLVAFLLNSRFTFNFSNKEQFKRKLFKYFIVNIFTLILGLSLLKIFVDVLYLNVYIMNFFVMGIQAVSNFTGSKLFVF
ncbi:MAG: GtrA family protein, partial [Nanoarchaeota archaeon]